MGLVPGFRSGGPVLDMLWVSRTPPVMQRARIRGQVRERGGLLQTVVVSVLILATAAPGYTMRTAAQQADVAISVAAAPAQPGGVPAAPVSPLGDLSTFPGSQQTPRTW